MFLLKICKRNIAGLIVFFMPLFICAQTQYDYYDDDSVAGGVDVAVSSLIIIVGLVLAFFVLAFIGNGLFSVYYWFNPEADPAYKKRKAKEVEEIEEKKKQEEFVQKQRQEPKPQAIDLGLSVEWASFNLGAYKPSDIGSNYLWSDNESVIYTKPENLNVNSIGDIAGNPKYDIATKRLGGKWRMPSAEECQELIEFCIWEKKVLDNVEGYKITGPNGNSIFLPYNQANIDNEKYGEYWTSSPTFTGSYSNAKELIFGLRIKSNAQIGSTIANIARLGIRPVFSNELKSFLKEDHTTDTINSLINKEKTIDEEIYSFYEEQCHIKETEIETYIMGTPIYYKDKIIKDEFGVIYSLDGKRLLDASDCNCATYTIKEGTEYVCKGAFRKRFFEYITKRGRKGGLWKIILPSSLVYIPASGVPDICQMESKCPHYCIINEILIDTRRRCAVKGLNPFLQELVLYGPIEEIGDKAFINCDQLQEVSLPNTLKKIGKNSFRNNKLLKTINFPDSIEIIEEEAFFGCDLLYINKLPDKLKFLGDSAFSGCIIRDVIIPDSIKYIGKAPFPKNCINLISESERFIISNGLLIDKTELAIIQFIDSSAKSVTIPQNITKICSCAFHHCDIETICIPSNIIEFGTFSFWGCKKLVEIVIYGHLHSIPTGTFDYCESLTSINIPSGVEIIETGAFNHCKLLQEVNLNHDLKEISNCAFFECPSLTSILLPESVRVIGDISQNKKYILSRYNQYFFKDCNNLQEVYYDAKNADISGFPSCITKLTIGEHVEVLPTSLLSYNYYIESFTIPANVRKVSKVCISNCPKLHEITILSKNIILEDGWIRDCDNLSIIHIQKDIYDIQSPSLPVRKGLKIKKIYEHHFLFFKW